MSSLHEHTNVDCKLSGNTCCTPKHSLSRFEQVMLGTIEAGIVGNNSLEAGMSQPLSVHETGHDNKVLTK